MRPICLAAPRARPSYTVLRLLCFTTLTEELRFPFLRFLFVQAPDACSPIHFCARSLPERQRRQSLIRSMACSVSGAPIRRISCPFLRVVSLGAVKTPVSYRFPRPRCFAAPRTRVLSISAPALPSADGAGLFAHLIHFFVFKPPSAKGTGRLCFYLSEHRGRESILQYLAKCFFHLMSDVVCGKRYAGAALRRVH